MFILRPVKEADYVRHVIKFDKRNQMRPPSKDTPEDSIAELVFSLQPNLGQDEAKIGDSMVVASKKGNTKLKMGTTRRERVLRGVAQIEGLADEDETERIRMTPLVYDLLPAWITNELADRLKELNGDDDDDEDEEGN